MTDAQNPSPRDAASVAADRVPTRRQDALRRERSAFGGIEWGSAFIGWLTATGTAVLLAALLGALGNPSIPVDAGSLAAGGVVAAVLALVGAILGGLAGTRFHRRVDRAGLGR